MSADKQLVEYAIRDVTIVVFEGNSILDPVQIQEIAQSLYYLVEGKACRKIVLDFAKVQLLSSAALGVLINLKKKAAAIKGQIVLCGVRRELMKAFMILHLDKMFEIRSDEKQGLGVFGVTTAG